MPQEATRNGLGTAPRTTKAHGCPKRRGGRASLTEKPSRISHTHTQTLSTLSLWPSGSPNCHRAQPANPEIAAIPTSEPEHIHPLPASSAGHWRTPQSQDRHPVENTATTTSKMCSHAARPLTLDVTRIHHAASDAQDGTETHNFETLGYNASRSLRMQYDSHHVWRVSERPLACLRAPSGRHLRERGSSSNPLKSCGNGWLCEWLTFGTGHDARIQMLLNFLCPLRTMLTHASLCCASTDKHANQAPSD